MVRSMGSQPFVFIWCCSPFDDRPRCSEMVVLCLAEMENPEGYEELMRCQQANPGDNSACRTQIEGQAVRGSS